MFGAARDGTLRLRRGTHSVRGRTVLVTGASSGIGAATAVELGRRGATVLAVARRAELLDQLVHDITSAGGAADFYACDLTKSDAIDAMVGDILGRHQVDMLVNNAGRSIRRSIPESWGRVHDFERTIAIN